MKSARQWKSESCFSTGSRTNLSLLIKRNCEARASCYKFIWNCTSLTFLIKPRLLTNPDKFKTFFFPPISPIVYTKTASSGTENGTFQKRRIWRVEKFEKNEAFLKRWTSSEHVISAPSVLIGVNRALVFLTFLFI